MAVLVGEPGPDFTLPDTAGKLVALRDQSPITIVVFTCNHCPYALAWHGRINAVAADYADKGVRTLQINANDSDRYPRDSVEAMDERVARGEFAGPYLHDSTQEVARAWGASVTPEVFVLDADGRVAYHGAPDADHAEPALDALWLRAALDAVLAGQTPSPSTTQPVGCTIKWR